MLIVTDWLVSRLCSLQRHYIARYGPFYVVDNKNVILNGALGCSVFNQVSLLLKDYPELSDLRIERCPGSLDDQELVKAGLLFHENNFHIHVLPKAKVYSGGVDLFLAGSRRTLGKDAKLGVHAWTDDDTGLSATDSSIEDHQHQMYIDYYADLGWSEADARKLYEFIINAAEPHKTYYLTEADLAAFNIVTT